MEMDADILSFNEQQDSANKCQSSGNYITLTPNTTSNHFFMRSEASPKH